MKFAPLRNGETMIDTIKLDTSNERFKLYINDILHLNFSLRNLLSTQSWIERDNTYWIEYTLKDNVILSEYIKIDTWKEILSLIDKQVKL